jgi:A/G-specific adenine glycosylase
MMLHYTMIPYQNINDFSALSAYHAAITAWYGIYGRHDLPWRQTQDAYAIYISEVMLQQTQVHTVLTRFYHPFLTQFPTLQALADAPLEEVLKAWEGLGYYTRARNLHCTAQQAAPKLPQTVEGLRGLRGIGRNTAQAIAAFAYRQPVAIMEANIRRVLHRFTASAHMSDNAAWEWAEALLDRADPFTYNQAMMDIGAMVCTPRTPRCDKCPIAEWCEGRESPERYPAAKARKTIPLKEVRMVMFECEGQWYLPARTTRFLGGLRGFPTYAMDAPIMLAGTVFALEEGQVIGNITHIYSHFRLQAEVVKLPCSAATKACTEADAWVAPEALPTLALSRADHKAVALSLQRPITLL